MFIKILLLVTLFSAFLIYGKSSLQLNPQNVSKSSIFLADPTIFYHEGVYYLYGTSGHDTNQGFLVYTSEDMQSWKGPRGVNKGYALRKGDVFGDKGFWAPQVFHYQDTFYMAYTANEHIAIAKSESPLGPFTQTTRNALAAPVKQIDPFVFIDDNGKKYLYHVRLTEGNRLYVAEMTDDFSAIKPETLKECISAEETWENTENVPWSVAEGPSILKHHHQYYLIYSANDFRNPDYAVGYAVSNNPYGPWKKYSGNPILSKEHISAYGTGHGDFVEGGDGDLYYVFHTHHSEKEVHPRKTAVVRARFTGFPNRSDRGEALLMEEESFYYLQVD